MNRKNKLLPIILLLFSSGLVISGLSEGIFIDNEWVRLEADPITLGSSDYVEFKLLSKIYEGPIDVAWAFNSEEASPKKPQIWANYTHELYRNVPANLTYIDENNETHYYLGSETEVYYETFFDWKPWDIDFTVINEEHLGFDKWFILEDVPIVKNKEYRVRAWIDVEFKGIVRTHGEYLFAIKPSGLSLSEAKAQGFLFVLDPYFDAEWAHSRRIYFNNTASSEDLEDFPVIVNLDSTNFDFSEIQPDGDDFRFTDEYTLNLIPYEIEYLNITEETGVLHVKPDVINASSESDFMTMYWGNPTASNGENITGVWVNGYRGVWHFNDETGTTALDSTSYNHDFLLYNTPIWGTGLIGGDLDFNSVLNQFGKFSYDITNDVDDLSVEILVNFDILDTNNRGLFGRNWDEGIGIQYTNTTFTYGIKPLDNNKVVKNYAHSLSVGEWNYIAMTYTSGDFKGYMNETIVVTETAWTGVIDDDDGQEIHIASTRSHLDDELDGKLDELRYSDVDRSPDWIEATNLNLFNQYLIFGSYEPQNKAPNPPTLTAPTSGTRYDLGESVLFDYTFSDPNSEDYQSAYQIQIDDNSDFSSPEVDSGKVYSANEYTNQYLPNAVNLDYWRVRTWDNHDLNGSWSVSRSVIAERIFVDFIEVTDYRPNIEHTVWFTIHLEYESDSLPITTGTWNLEDKALSHDVDGNWTCSDSLLIVGNKTYDEVWGVVGYVSGVNLNGQDKTIVWDKQVLTLLGCNNTKPAINETVKIWALSESKYDGHNLTTGDDLELEDIPFSHNGTFWVAEVNYSYSITFVIDEGECNETTYDISAFSMNGTTLSIMWGKGTQTQKDINQEFFLDMCASWGMLGLVVSLMGLSLIFKTAQSLDPSSDINPNHIRDGIFDMFYVAMIASVGFYIWARITLG